MHIVFLRDSLWRGPSVVCCAVLSVVIILTSCWRASGVASAQGSTLLPNGSEVPGWRMADKPYDYGPQDLWKYINGEADFFVAYGFVSLKGANYVFESDPNYSIGVDVFDMGEKLNAFGVFQSKRSNEPSSLRIGAASFGAGGYVVFYKDRYYVEILSFGEGKEWRTEHLAMAQKVAEKIQGNSSPPDELSYLPETGKIEGSERYIKGGILGHGFLDRGLICGYHMEGHDVSAFVAFFPSSEDAASSFEKHKVFLQGSGSKCLPLKGFGERAFSSQEPYHKEILVAQKRSFVVGVYDLLTAQKGTELLERILKKTETAN
jgi:hypothetical protein